MRAHSVADVAAAVRGRRLDLGLTQSELANDSGISRKWISEFEAGKARAEFGLVMRVIEALGLTLDLGEGHSAAGTGRAVDLDDVIEEYETR